MKMGKPWPKKKKNMRRLKSNAHATFVDRTEYLIPIHGKRWYFFDGIYGCLGCAAILKRDDLNFVVEKTVWRDMYIYTKTNIRTKDG